MGNIFLTAWKKQAVYALTWLLTTIIIVVNLFKMVWETTGEFYDAYKVFICILAVAVALSSAITTYYGMRSYLAYQAAMAGQSVTTTP